MKTQVSRAIAVVLSTLTVSIFVLSLTSTAASAHGIGGAGPTNSKTIIKSIKPSTNSFDIVPIENGEKVKLTRTSNEDIIVLGVDKEPYILINEKGTFINEKSATRIINRSMDSSLTQEEENREYAKTSADPKQEPKWIKESSSQTYRWHDHRSHYMGSIPDDVSNLGTSSLPIMTGSGKHLVSLEFVTTDAVNSTPYLVVLIILSTIIVGSVRFKTISTFLSSRVFLTTSTVLLSIFSIIHISGYIRFSDTSIMQSLIASLYGIIFTIFCFVLSVKLFKDRTQNWNGWLSKHSPILCGTGFLGITAGSLIEYEVFTYRYLSSSLNQTFVRTLVLLVAVLSLNILVYGLRFIKTNSQEQLAN